MVALFAATSKKPLPQGFDYAPDGDLLAGNGIDDSLVKLDAVTGESRGTFIAPVRSR